MQYLLNIYIKYELSCSLVAYSCFHHTEFIHRVWIMVPYMVARRLEMQLQSSARGALIFRPQTRTACKVAKSPQHINFPAVTRLTLWCNVFWCSGQTSMLPVRHRGAQCQKGARLGLRGSGVKRNCHWQFVGRHSVSRFLAREETNAQRQKLPPVPFIHTCFFCPNTN